MTFCHTTKNEQRYKSFERYQQQNKMTRHYKLIMVKVLIFIISAKMLCVVEDNFTQTEVES